MCNRLQCLFKNFNEQIKPGFKRLVERNLLVSADLTSREAWSKRKTDLRGEGIVGHGYQGKQNGVQPKRDRSSVRTFKTSRRRWLELWCKKKVLLSKFNEARKALMAWFVIVDFAQDETFSAKKSSAANPGSIGPPKKLEKPSKSDRHSFIHVPR